MTDMQDNRRRDGAAAIVVLAAALCALLGATLPGTAHGNTLSGLPKPLFAFGLNQFGQLGNVAGVGTGTAQPGPLAVAFPNPSAAATVAAAAVGGDHSLVLTNAGTLYAFGTNYYGQLGSTSGNGSSGADATLTAVSLPAGSGVVTAVAAGSNHSLVVTASGQLFAFGSNTQGQLGATPNVDPHPAPTVVTLPRTFPIIRTKAAKAVAVAAAGNSSYAINSNGQLFAFGDDAYGQLGIAGASAFSVYPTPTLIALPGENGPVTQVAAGSDYALALTSSGQLYAFGDNSDGQLGLPLTTSHTTTPTLVAVPGHGTVTQVAAGSDHTLVATSTGQLYSFGSNQFGQLGTETDASSTAGRPTPELVALPPDAAPVREIAASGDSSFAVTADGTLYSWGKNNYGQLGNAENVGTTKVNPDPVAVTVPGGATIENLARGASASHMLAIVSSLAVTTTTLPVGTVGSPYSQNAAAGGGVAPYSWSAAGLPHGLTISASGAVTGTPTAAGTATVVLTVTDANGIESSSAPISLTIAAAASTTTTGPTSSNPATIATLATLLRTQLPARVTLATLLARGTYNMTLHGLGTGKIAIRWLHRPVHRSAVLVADGHARTGAANVVVTLRLTAAGRRLLAHVKHLTVTVVATFTPNGGKAVRATRMLILVPKHGK